MAEECVRSAHNKFETESNFRREVKKTLGSVKEEKTLRFVKEEKT